MQQPQENGIKFQEPPFEDTGNHTISIPDYQTYSKQNGILKTMPQLKNFMSQTTRHPQKQQFNINNGIHHLNNTNNNQQNFDITERNVNQDQEIINQKMMTPTISRHSLSRRSSSLPKQFQNTQNQFQNLSPFTNTTIIFKRIPPHSTGLIPQTWTSCQCPRLNQRHRSQCSRESFRERNGSRTYYDKGFYSYLKKYSGEQSPKMREINSLYNRVRNQKIEQTQGFQLPQHIQKSSYTEAPYQQQQSTCQQFIETSPTTTKQFATTLHLDDRSQQTPKLQLPNPIISDILKNSEDVLQNPQLVQQIIKLKKQQNLTKYDIVNFCKKNEKVKYIYNDYHTIGSKGGYSRGDLGSFYTR